MKGKVRELSNWREVERHDDPAMPEPKPIYKETELSFRGELLENYRITYDKSNEKVIAARIGGEYWHFVYDAELHQMMSRMLNDRKIP